MHLTNRSAERRLLVIRDRARDGARKQVSAKVQAYLSGETFPDETANSTEVLDPKIERRRVNRRTVSSDALVRRVGGFSFEVALKDISPNGCRVEMLEPCEAGDTAITRFPQLEPLGCRICWTQGTTTGMQFATTMHPAVFDMLLGRLSRSAIAA